MFTCYLIMFWVSLCVFYILLYIDYVFREQLKSTDAIVKATKNSLFMAILWFIFIPLTIGFFIAKKLEEKMRSDGEQ